MRKKLSRRENMDLKRSHFLSYLERLPLDLSLFPTL